MLSALYSHMLKLLLFTSFSSSFTFVCLCFVFRILYPVFSDLWGLVTLSIATSYYLKFNAVMYFNLEEEAPSSLYLYGDYWYVVNSLVYTLCAMRDNECFWFMPTNGRPPAFLDIAKAHYFSNVDEKVFDEVDIGSTTLKSGADKSSSSKSGGGWSMSGKGKGNGSSGCEENDDGVHDALLSSSRVEDEDDDVMTGRDRDSRKERDRERERRRTEEKPNSWEDIGLPPVIVGGNIPEYVDRMQITAPALRTVRTPVRLNTPAADMHRPVHTGGRDRGGERGGSELDWKDRDKGTDNEGNRTDRWCNFRINKLRHRHSSVVRRLLSHHYSPS